MTSSRRIIAVTLSLLASSCASTITHEFEHEPVESYEGQQPAPGKIGLLLTGEFESFVFEGFGYGNTHRYPMGAALAQSAELLGRALFPDMVVIHGEVVPNDIALVAVLVPKCAVSIPLHMMGWEESITTVSLEWTLRAPDGQVLWAATADGEARGAMGSRFSAASNTAQYLNKALSLALRKSYEMIGMAAEVRSAMASSR